MFVNNMKFLLFFVLISFTYADPATSSSGSTETSNKSEGTKSQNSIPQVSSNSKSSYFNSPRVPTFVQLVQKPNFPYHNSVPHTMLIIAQPAFIPQNVVYNQASNHHAQQLLNYFHSNPAAKYQFLYGYQPNHQYQPATSGSHQPQQQQHQAPQVFYAIAQPIPASTHSSPTSYQNYQYLTPQLYNYQPHPHQHQSMFTHPQYTPSTGTYHSPQYQIPATTYTQHALPIQSSTHQQSTQNFVPSQQQPITQPISGHLTQAPPPTVQSPSPTNHQYSSHYYDQGPQTFTQQTPIKTAAPIITGLENFTPEQQAQIKEQLSSHFGGLTQINSNSLQVSSPHGEYTAKFKIDVGTPSEEYSSSSSTQTETSLKSSEGKDDSQSSSQHYASPLQSNSFTPPTYTFRTPQYTKG